MLTAKINMSHNCRNRIRVQMGISTDLSSETPDVILGFPVFDYQGGCQFMQGGTSNPDHKIIEFGLDITPFLNMIESGTPVRYFLLIEEDDPEGWGFGNMISFSIMDYTNGVEEIICDQSNVTLTHNDLSKFWVDHTVNFTGIEITTDELMPAAVYEPYSEQLEADGGAEPYIWGYDMNFTETSTTTTFPMVDEEDITPGGTNNGYSVVDLDFVFPFYDYKFDYVRVNVDGFISFEEMFSWPYSVYDFFNFTKNKLISPFQSDLRLYTNSGDGIWYEGDENSATFRWRASINGFENTSEINIAVQLFSNGDIIYYYGDVNTYPGIEWISGISSGDNIFYQFTEISNDPTITPNLEINLEATKYPNGFTMSRTGEFSGTPEQTYDDFGVKFMVIGENNLKTSKVLNFSTDGSNFIVVKSVTVSSGDDDVIEFGETTELTIEVESLGDETIYGTDMVISTDGIYITLIDSTETLGDFEPGEIKTFELAFSFEVDNLVPNDHEIDLGTLISDNSGEDWSSHIYLTAYAPDLSVSSVIIDDGGSGGLDPGETADMIVKLHNGGGADVSNIEAVLSSIDPYITINSSIFNLDEISAGSNGNFVFNVTASGSTPAAYIIEFDVDISADNDYSTTGQAYVVCGLLIEGFETGNFSAFPWTFGGDDEWNIDDNTFYEGFYSARSGIIGDQQTSSMELDIFVLGDGEISFFRKVSSEATYDYLRFYINDFLMDQWAGEEDWAQETYNVSTGLNTFKWEYYKDGSVSNGSDCGWIDNIMLPPFGDQDPQLWYMPESYLVIIEENIAVQDSLTVFNAGAGPLMYSAMAIDSLGNSVDWIVFETQNGGLNPGDEDVMPITFDGTELEEGLYEAEIILTDHINNEYIIPVWFYVDLTIGISENEFISGSRSIPNPFNQYTFIEFNLEKTSQVTIEIYNSNGTRIKNLVRDQVYNQGTYNLKWDATNNEGGKVDQGLYYYRISANTESNTGKMILMN